MKTTFIATLTPLIAALLLAGCASTANFTPTATPAAPTAFKEADGHWTSAAPAEAQARGRWWAVFADPVLDGLVQRADANNTSIQFLQGSPQSTHPRKLPSCLGGLEDLAMTFKSTELAAPKFSQRIDVVVRNDKEDRPIIAHHFVRITSSVRRRMRFDLRR